MRRFFAHVISAWQSFLFNPNLMFGASGLCVFKGRYFFKFTVKDLTTGQSDEYFSG